MVPPRGPPPFWWWEGGEGATHARTLYRSHGTPTNPKRHERIGKDALAGLVLGVVERRDASRTRCRSCAAAAASRSTARAPARGAHRAQLAREGHARRLAHEPHALGATNTPWCAGACTATPPAFSLRRRRVAAVAPTVTRGRRDDQPVPASVARARGRASRCAATPSCNTPAAARAPAHAPHTSTTSASEKLTYCGQPRVRVKSRGHAAAAAQHVHRVAQPLPRRRSSHARAAR